MRDGPSTSTSSVRPTKRCARSCARRWTTSTRRSMRSTLTSCGTRPSVMRRRLGPAPRREDEGEGAVVADLLADLERLREVLLGLAREADDDVGGDRAVGHVLADERDAVQVAPAVVGAAHRLEDRARARLQRQVDVLADRGQLGVGADDVLAHVLGVRARVAQAVEPVDGVQRVQQLGEGAPVRTQVAPVGVDVLAQQRDLARAVGDLRADLVDELVERPRRPRARAWRARCSTSSGSCSRPRSAPRPGTRGRAWPAGGR